MAPKCAAQARQAYGRPGKEIIRWPEPDPPQKTLRTAGREHALDPPPRVHLFPGILNELQARSERVTMAVGEFVFVKGQFEHGAFVHQAEAHGRSPAHCAVGSGSLEG